MQPYQRLPWCCLDDRMTSCESRCAGRNPPRRGFMDHSGAALSLTQARRIRLPYPGVSKGRCKRAVKEITAHTRGQKKAEKKKTEQQKYLADENHPRAPRLKVA